MSAFAVVINTNQAPVDASLLRAMTGLTSSGSFEAELKIDGCVGLATAHHLSSADDGGCSAVRNVWAVLDGRLDDRETLITALAGSSGAGDLERLSDVDLLVLAYEKWGDDCVSHMLGDFSFGLWDHTHRRLLCARDHFGVKPLYFARVGSVLVVASVLRWLRRHPFVSRRLREEAIGDFLLFGVFAEPSQTAFADISRVPPGHRLSHSPASGSTQVSRYWALEPGEPIRYADGRDYVEQFSELLRVAVADRVRTGPVGLLMSGGLDSSSVAAVAAQVLDSRASDRLRAFTVVYDAIAEDEERHYSSLVARSLGFQISHISADQYQPFERWDADSLPMEPSLEGLTAIMNDVLSLVSRHGSVVLTGDGGDPLLLPTPVSLQVGRVPALSLAADLFRAWRLGMRPPLGIRSRITGWLLDSSDVPGWLGGDLVNTFDVRARWRQIMCRGKADRSGRSTAVNEITNPWWASTFESFDPGATERRVELRYPFFDVRLASFVLRLPSFPWCLNKHVLREATRGRLPETVRLRSKTPLASPPGGTAGRWSSRRACELFEATPEIVSFVDVRKFRALVEGDSLLTNDSLSAWAAISLAMWLRCDRAEAPAVSRTP